MSKTKSKQENATQEKAGGDCPRTHCSPSYSDTPETDEEAFVATYDYWESVDVVRISVSERLERERNEARNMLRKAVDNLSHGYECRGALRPNDCRCGYMGLLYAVEKLSLENDQGDGSPDTKTQPTR